MAGPPQQEIAPELQLCLDDEKFCPRGPIPVVVSSLSGTGLAVLMLNNQAGLLNPAQLMLEGSEGRPLRLAARIGQRSIALTAQLVWSEAGSTSEEIELIIDASGATDWPAIVAAYRGAA